MQNCDSMNYLRRQLTAPDTKCRLCLVSFMFSVVMGTVVKLSVVIPRKDLNDDQIKWSFTSMKSFEKS
jgi:hypothetical protein